MSDGIEVKSSSINGRGVFAARQFHKDEVVVRWANTQKIGKAEYAALPQSERRYIEIQNDEILLVGEPERYVNHSCDPNTIPGDFCDIATRDINPDEEITANYGNFFIPDGRFTCACGSPKCRGIIEGRK